MPSCSVKWCSNHTSTCSLKLKNGVSFHRFPKDESICKKWVEAVRFERRDPWWTSTNASRICSIHFKESDISSTPCKVNILSKTAVPVCTMVWSGDHENNVTLKTYTESTTTTNTDKTILKTYERKKTKMNVLKESKVNNSYSRNKEDLMTKTNKVAISCNPRYLTQDNIPEATKIIKPLKGSKTLSLKASLEPNINHNLGLKTDAKENVTAIQKKNVLAEVNNQEYVKSCTKKCYKSEILVKLNDNTSLILDEGLSNDGDIIMDSNKDSTSPNTRISEISKKVNVKELKSNDNKEPNQEVNNVSNLETFITNGNMEFNENISRSFVGKMLKTYLPKRRDKINEKNTTETSKNLNKNKDMWSSKKFNNCIYMKNNYMADLKSKQSSQELNKLCAFKNEKKYFFKRKSKLLNRSKSTEHNKLTTDGKPNIDENTESNISHIDEFITNQSRIDKIEQTDTTVYDEILSELFETCENVKNVSDIANSNYQETNENNINSAFCKGTSMHNSMHVNSDLDSNDYNITPTLIIKENTPISVHKAGSDINNIIAVKDWVTTLKINNNTDAGKEIPLSNVTSPKQSNSISLEKFLTNISLKSNDSKTIDFITSLNIEPSTTKEAKLIKQNISDITKECNKTHEKDMPELNWELCGKVDIACSNKNITVMDTERDINADRYNKNIENVSNVQLLIINKNLPMENLHSDHLITESNYYLNREMNRNNSTQSNKNICNDENITYNARKLYNKELKNLKTSVVNNIGNVTKKDNFTELKKLLSMKLKLDCTFESCTSIVTDTDKNMFSKYDSINITEKYIQVPDQDRNLEFDENSNMDVNDNDTKQNNINNTTRETKSNVTRSKQCKSILDEELLTNITPEPNNKEHILDNNECKKILETDIPEINTVILPKLNEDEILNCEEVINIKFHNLNKEMFNDNDLLFRKSDKNFVNVLAMPEDQHTVVTEHMDVVNSILNKEIAAEFDLSLLLSDTPIPDEDIQNLDNSNYNSLDAIAGSPNWIELPSGEIPKIIDDILDQGSQPFENLDLFDKVNNSQANKVYVEDKEKYSPTNVDQFKKHIINNFYETGKQCAKNSIAEIEKQLIAEFSECNENNLKHRNNICNENKVSQCKNITDKQILQQYLQSNNEQCVKNNLNQIVDNCNEHSDKEIQGGNKTINQCEKTNKVDSKTSQIEDPSINLIFKPYFEQYEESQLTLIDINTFKLSKKQYAKQSTEHTNQTSVGNLTTTEKEIPECKILNQSNLGSSFQERNKQLSKDFNKDRTEEVNKVSKEAHTGKEGRSKLNFGKLKRVIFEECYDSECRNKCKHQKHNSHTESHKEEDKQQDKKLTNYTPYDVFYKQCNSSNINSSNKLNVGSSDLFVKRMRKKSFLEHHKWSQKEKYRTKYKKIAIDHIPGQYLELKWKESLGKYHTISEEGCKRKNKDLGLDQRKILCSESTKNISQQIMAECPECGYTTDDNDLMNYQSDVDLRITKPLSLINKDMLISLRDKAENNGINNKVSLESVYAMELAYVTAIQALERKLKQKIALSEYRLRKVNKLSKINNKLIKANITFMDFSHDNKV